MGCLWKENSTTIGCFLHYQWFEAINNADTSLYRASVRHLWKDTKLLLGNLNSLNYYHLYILIKIIANQSRISNKEKILLASHYILQIRPTQLY